MSETFHNRFPSYDVLDKWDSPSWNEQTRAVIAKRLHQIPDRRFFTETEWDTLRAICDRLIPQPDR
ncbi:MAG TPA: gluconate 2-dehydrogenase subunit 3 family protein, partial [Stellaceae bacterium]|nr:gluconate 2-dehydrogenase subunit 3 family protein [Stellaceae bacterium]